MWRSLALAACLALTGCSSAVAPTPSTTVATASPTLEIRATLTPTAKPTPAPTAAPSLSFGDISYNPNACWRNDWTDSGGHLVGGIQVNFAVTVRNPATGWTPRVWFRVLPGVLTSETDILKTSWSSRVAYTDGAGLLLGGPEVPKGSLKLAWSVLFASGADVHYRVAAVVLSPGETIQGIGDLNAREVETWAGNWTASVIC